MEKNLQLIFSFYRHPQLGISLNAYLIQLLASGSFSYQYSRLVFERIGDYDYPFSEEDKIILRLINELSQSAIENYFNRKKLKWEIFLEKVAADKSLTLALSGYFDRRLSKCLALLKGRQVFWQSRPSDHPGMKEYHVMTMPPKALYTFSKTDDGIHYRLEVSFNGRKLDLQRKGTEIISGEPCWILHNGSFYGFTDGTDGNKLKPFLKKNEIHIPDRLSDQYLSSFMLKASRKFEVQFEGFNTQSEPSQIRKVLRLTGGFEGMLKIQLEFHYDHLIALASGQQPVLVQLQDKQNSKVLFRFKRDFTMEDEASAWLLAYGLKAVTDSWYIPENHNNDEFASVEWLRTNYQLLEENNFFVEHDFEGNKLSLSKLNVELVSIDTENDWFDIKAYVQIGDMRVPFTKLRKNILENNRKWVLPDGSLVLLPEAWFKLYTGIFEFAEDASGSLRLHKQHQGLIDGHPLTTGEFSHRLADEKRNIYNATDFEIKEAPQSLKATLREYQLIGYSWLCNLRQNGLGACLADDMGLGKTIQVIALLLAVQEDTSDEDTIISTDEPDVFHRQLDLFAAEEPLRPQGSPALIVMAPSLVHNWMREISKFAPSFRVYVHAGQKRGISAKVFNSADVILSTYGVVRNDIELFKNYRFSTIVLDESQLIKNVRSVTYQRVRQLFGTQRIVLTGTPVENSLSDLWSQLNFLQPGLLGSFAWFKKEFIVPVEKQNNIPQLEKLKKIIRPFILRRTKAEVTPELPELTRLEHFCEMDAEQRERYEEIKSTYRNSILQMVNREGMQKSQLMILRGLMQLRKIAIHPSLDDANYQGSSAKFEQVLDRLVTLQAEGRKVLMFSQFVKHLDLYKAWFLRKQMPFSMLTGSVPMQSRAAVLQEFERSQGFRVFLIQLRTGGSGLNLTQADSVFILDPWWNPAAEEQAISRSHRIGQHQPVFVWKFITRDTIEEKILKLQERKSKLAGDIVSSGSPLNALSREELEELFS